jgi:dTDP-4-amino-4,6-dideoxygalactose transaminase
MSFTSEKLGGAWFEAEVEGWRVGEEERGRNGERVSERVGEESTFQRPPGPERVDEDSATKRSTVNFQLSTNNSPTGIYFLKEPAGYFSNRWLTTILVNPEETGGVTREDIRLALEEENIESRPLWKPMHQQPLYEDAPYYGNGISDFLFEYGLCLPSGSNLTDKDREKVVEVIKKVLGKNG